LTTCSGKLVTGDGKRAAGLGKLAAGRGLKCLYTAISGTFRV